MADEGQRFISSVVYNTDYFAGCQIWCVDMPHLLIDELSE